MTKIPTLRLVRFDSNDAGTFGRLRQWVSLEEEDLNNMANKSCIPPGTYICQRTVYHKKGYETFEVTRVPGRSRILFHPANTEEDIEGCIGLGMTLGVLERMDEELGYKRHKLAVLSSQAAFKQFMASMEGVDEFVLIVEEFVW